MRTLSAGAKLAYSAPAFALALAGIPVYVYIPKFYTDVVGVHITALGGILLFVRLFDAFTDPLIGVVSDRLRTPMGRRRPLIAGGAVFTVLSVVFLFNPPAGMSGAVATGWFLVLIFALFLFQTIVIVPYESLGPELTFDYNERTALFSVRDGALVAGTLAAVVMPGLVGWLAGLDEGPDSQRRVFLVLSVLYAPLILGACAWCVAAFRERPARTGSSGIAVAETIRESIRSSLANRPFRILLIAYTISAIGNNLPATLILYYVEYVLASSRAGLFLALYFVTGIVFLPLWVRLARRTGKKAAWLSAMAINTGSFFWVFFLGPGDDVLYGILVFCSGIGFGATLAIPSAIQADVIDYDELSSGQRREGLYIGIWSIARKMAAAVGVGAGLVLLGGAGYQPGTQQDESVVLMLRVLYALVPSLCNALAIVAALNYPISADVQRRIHGAIRARARGEPAEDPLVPGRRFPGR